MFKSYKLRNLTQIGIINRLNIVQQFNLPNNRLNVFNNCYKSIELKNYVIYNNNNIRHFSIYKHERSRYYSNTKEHFKKVDDDYYLRKNNNDSETFLLGVTKEKFKDFKEIVFINFTDEKEVKKGEYLFSVEDSKTLFDFYSPLECEIEEVNPKFSKGVSEEKLKELFESPENEDNYLVRVKLKKH